MNKKRMCFTFLAFFFWNAQGLASEVAFFHRCYAHLTGMKAPSSHVLVVAIKKKEITGLQACVNLLNGVTLATDGALSPMNSENQNILETFYKFHREWFLARNFLSSTPPSTKTFFDLSEPALHLTQILFGKKANGQNRLYSELLKAQVNVEAIRSASTPTGPLFTAKGKLIGIQAMNTIKKNEKVNLKGTSTSVSLNSYFGGGVLGTQSYLIQNYKLRPLDKRENARTDGGIKVARNYSVSVLNDFLCRSLPAIRLNDASQFVQTGAQVTSSTPSFRTGLSCMQCHSTIDPMANTLRNFQYEQIDAPFGAEKVIAHFIYKNPVNLPSESGIVDQDPLFYRRPAQGSFYFRGYDGTLHSSSLRSLQDLGDRIAESKDFYACAASRYLKYFTGLEANLSDIGDPFVQTRLSDSEIKVRNYVISLGENLKTHQNLKKLIEEILKSPLYQNPGVYQ